jgi:hypothetical protein
MAGLFFASALSHAQAAPSSGDQPVYAWTPENVDVDALAARMKNYPDLYPQIRDEALAA